MPAQKRHRKTKNATSTASTPWFDQIAVLNGAHEAEHFVAAVFDRDRRQPVVAISLPQDTGQPRVPVAQLVDQLDGTCQIVALGDPETTWACSRALGENLKVYGGAIRLLMPGAAHNGEPWGHPLFTTPPGGDGAATIRSLVARLRADGYLPPEGASTARLSVVRDSETAPAGTTALAAAMAAATTSTRKAAPPKGRKPQQTSTSHPVRSVDSPPLTGHTSPAPVLAPDDTAAAPVRPAPAPAQPTVIAPEPEPEIGPGPGSPATEAVLTDLALANEHLAAVEHDRDRLAAAHRDLTRALATANARRLAAERLAEQAGRELVDVRTQLVDALAQIDDQTALAARDLDAEWASTVAAAKDERDTAITRAEKAETDAVLLRKKVKSLTAQNQELADRMHGRSAWSDPETQFRHEVFLDWLHEVPEEDRVDRYAPRQYRLGPDFLESVDKLDGIRRERIIAAAREIICQQVWTSNSRQAHQLRTHAAGNSPAVKRDDGGIAWRCNLQTKTASARRFMWWEFPDGTIELGRVAVHDDMDLR